MTPPRQVLPGTTYLVTRRCAERRFFLRPSRITNDIFRYVLALAAQRFGVRIHAFCVMSNHCHLLVTDPHARLPDFERYLDSLVARAMNSVLGRWEHFWAPSSYSAVTLATPGDILDKATYLLADPVAAGLTPSACFRSMRRLTASRIPSRVTERFPARWRSRPCKVSTLSPCSRRTLIAP